MNDLNVGDFMECHDKKDAVENMMALAQEGIETDFCYEHHGEQGIWLEVLKIGYKR